MVAIFLKFLLQSYFHKDHKNLHQTIFHLLFPHQIPLLKTLYQFLQEVHNHITHNHLLLPFLLDQNLHLLHSLNYLIYYFCLLFNSLIKNLLFFHFNLFKQSYFRDSFIMSFNYHSLLFIFTNYVLLIHSFTKFDFFIHFLIIRNLRIKCFVFTIIIYLYYFSHHSNFNHVFSNFVDFNFTKFCLI